MGFILPVLGSEMGFLGSILMIMGVIFCVGNFTFDSYRCRLCSEM